MEDNRKQVQQSTGPNRRDFLKGVVAAGGGAAWALASGARIPHALAAAAPITQAAIAPDFTIVEISDTHLGFTKAANPHVTETFEEVIQRLNALPQQPAFVVHTGDHAHNSKPSELDTAKQLLGTIKVDRTFSIPGEHDVFLDQGRAYRSLFAKGAIGTGYWSLDYNGVHFIGLVNDAGALGTAQGTLGPTQLAWIKQDLSSISSDTPLILFSHVPLLPVYVPWGWSTSDSDSLLAIVSRFNAVTALNGHIHQRVTKASGNVVMHTSNPTSFPDHAPGQGTPTPLTVPSTVLPSRLGFRIAAFVSGAARPAVIDITLG